MDKENLSRCLRCEVEHWSAKSYGVLQAELRDVVAYCVGEGAESYQVEVRVYRYETSIHERRN
jgi:hypothetical protein